MNILVFLHPSVPHWNNIRLWDLCLPPGIILLLLLAQTSCRIKEDQACVFLINSLPNSDNSLKNLNIPYKAVSELHSIGRNLLVWFEPTSCWFDPKPPNLTLPVSVTSHSLLHMPKGFMSVETEKPQTLWNRVHRACAIPLTTFFFAFFLSLCILFKTTVRVWRIQNVGALWFTVVSWRGRGLNPQFLPWVGGSRRIPRY